MDFCLHLLEIICYYFTFLLGCIIKYVVLYSLSNFEKVYSQHFTKIVESPQS